ncbi:uncharacterized protein LOC126839562 [Adelges cooleyi]|uniref:uncharacterized protein LOC126839562 n=1 Tax=Adelges cooleyi TaxID=133065 RepID=UPI0021809AFD|nr:uncharacterized protein LOC126839562 [Adelges cooleyi]
MLELYKCYKNDNECLANEKLIDTLTVRRLKDKVEMLVKCDQTTMSNKKCDDILTLNDLVALIEAYVESFSEEHQAVIDERNRFRQLADERKNMLHERNTALAEVEKRLAAFGDMDATVRRYQDDLADAQAQLADRDDIESELRLSIERLTGESNRLQRALADERANNARNQESMDRLLANMAEANANHAAEKHRADDRTDRLQADNERLQVKKAAAETVVQQQMDLLFRAVETIKTLKAEREKLLWTLEQNMQCAGEASDRGRALQDSSCSFSGCTGCRPRTAAGDAKVTVSRKAIEDTLKKFERYAREFNEVADDAVTTSEDERPTIMEICED